MAEQLKSEIGKGFEDVFMKKSLKIFGFILGGIVGIIFTKLFLLKSYEDEKKNEKLTEKEEEKKLHQLDDYYDDYIRRRDEFNKIRSDTMDSVDKIILTLSTGTLVLSITFLDKIGKPINYSFILVCSWCFLMVSLLLNILSFIFARINIENKIQDLDDKYEERKEDKKYFVEKNFIWEKWTDFCNYFALFSFLIGIISFFIYALIIIFDNCK
ncbi:MAG: hypothetical protein AABY84_06515 [Candidatus Firestonebacteria bacterium]